MNGGKYMKNTTLDIIFTDTCAYVAETTVIEVEVDGFGIGSSHRFYAWYCRSVHSHLVDLIRTSEEQYTRSSLRLCNIKGQK